MRIGLKPNSFLENIFEDFIQLSGDRFYGEDKSLISGFARFEGKSSINTRSRERRRS